MNIELAGDGTRPQEKEEEESVVVTSTCGTCS
jgi:hypothetical protein